jgi:hypothetical protein
MNRFLKIVFALLLPVIAVLAGCTQDRLPCLQPTIQHVLAGMYHASDSAGIITISSINLPSPEIGTIGAKNNQMLYYGLNSAGHTYALGLSANADSCTYFIKPDTGSVSVFDTLSFYYQPQLYFLSNACGYTYFYNLNHVTTTNHNIDSVILETNLVSTNVNVEHLKIYFH